MSVSDIKICKCLVSNQTNMRNVHPLEVVGRGSETQLHVLKNLGKITGLKWVKWVKLFHLNIHIT